MIITRLMGGLGNQMFQYADGKRLADKHGVELKLDLSWFENEGKNAEAKRVFELSCFNLSSKIATPEELAMVKGGDSVGLMGKLFGSKTGITKFTEKAYSFDPAILGLPDNVLIEGYWQSEENFADDATAIKHDFAFNTEAEGKNAEMLNKITTVNSVSLHVRRGDYVTGPTASQFHGLQPLDYYKEAIKQVSEKVEGPHFFVFSDDPKWCRNNLKFDHPTTFIDHNPPDKGFEDMRLMRSCKHHIIANSSFSWWGAWLGENPDRIVYAPKRWFNDPSIDTSDVAAKGWITL